MMTKNGRREHDIIQDRSQRPVPQNRYGASRELDVNMPGKEQFAVGNVEFEGVQE